LYDFSSHNFDIYIRETRTMTMLCRICVARWQLFFKDPLWSNKIATASLKVKRAASINVDHSERFARFTIRGSIWSDKSILTREKVSRTSKGSDFPPRKIMKITLLRCRSFNKCRYNNKVARFAANAGKLLLLAISRRQSFPWNFFRRRRRIYPRNPSDELGRPAVPVEQITRLLLFLRATGRTANFTSER